MNTDISKSVDLTFNPALTNEPEPEPEQPSAEPPVSSNGRLFSDFTKLIKNYVNDLDESVKQALSTAKENASKNMAYNTKSLKDFGSQARVSSGNVAKKISDALTVQTGRAEGKSVFSLANTIIMTHEALESIDNKEWGDKSKFSAKLATEMGSRLILIPLATAYQVASTVLKCIKQIPSDIIQAAEVGKAELSEEMQTIKLESSTIKKTALIAGASIKAFGKFIGRAVISTGSTAALGTANALTFTLKGAVVMISGAKSATGGKVFSSQTFAKKSMKNINDIYTRFEKLNNKMRNKIGLDKLEITEKIKHKKITPQNEWQDAAEIVTMKRLHQK